MIEIAIAIAVIGFALVAIIGILPRGLEVQRDNRSETIINQDGTFWLEAIRNGARGYIPLSCKPCVLQHVLPLIMAGEVYIPASALRALRHENGHGLLPCEQPSPRTVMSPADSLTPRQCEITIMLADGKSNKEIARELRCAEVTVEFHVTAILRKSGCESRSAVAAKFWSAVRDRPELEGRPT